MLDVEQRQVVAQGVDHRQVGAAARVLAAPRAGAVELVAVLDEEGLRRHRQHEVVAVPRRERLERGDEVDDHGGGRGAEVRVSRVQVQRVPLEVDVDPVQPVGVDDRAHGGDERVPRGGRRELDLTVLPADRQEHLLPGRALGGDGGLELRDRLHVRALCPRAEAEPDVAGRDARRLAEREVDDVPRVRDVRHPDVARAVGERRVQVADERVRRQPGAGSAPGAAGRRGDGDGGGAGRLARAVGRGDLEGVGGGGGEPGDGGGRGRGRGDAGAVAVDGVAGGAGDGAPGEGHAGGGGRPGGEAGGGRGRLRRAAARAHETDVVDDVGRLAVPAVHEDGRGRRRRGRREGHAEPLPGRGRGRPGGDVLRRRAARPEVRVGALDPRAERVGRRGSNGDGLRAARGVGPGGRAPERPAAGADRARDLLPRGAGAGPPGQPGLEPAVDGELGVRGRGGRRAGEECPDERGGGDQGEEAAQSSSAS